MRKNAAIVVVGLAALALGGCGDFSILSPFRTYTPLQIQSVERKGTVIQPDFSNAVYYTDTDKIVHVVSEASGTDPATGAAVRQILLMRIFWIPVGGKTSVNPTSINMTFRYLLISDQSAAQYEGAGFARLNDEAEAPELRVRVVDADLRMTEKTSKFTDVLQRCRVLGNVTARRDDNAAVERMMKAKQDFFAATFDISKNSTRPAETAPATTSAPATQP